MIRINIHDAKTHLSKYLGFLKKGEVIMICKRNEPVAEIRPVTPRLAKPRTIGWAKGQFEITEEFFKPLPQDILDPFIKKDP